MVGKPTLVEVFEHGEGMRPDCWQERIGGPVKELDRRQVGLEVAVTDELLDGFGIAHQGARLALIPQSVGVPDAVGAVQRTALDVVEAQAALAVLDNLTGAIGQARELRLAQEWNG